MSEISPGPAFEKWAAFCGVLGLACVLGAHGIRTRILEDVTRFCKGNFHDDASLMVVTVE